jgi:hypothetical protein
LKTQWVYSLHKPARKKFPRRKYVSRSINYQWQADLMDMQKYSRENEGYRYILIVIDLFSRKAYAEPVKSKSGPDMVDALEKILIEARPSYLQTDQGLEFYNIHVKQLLDKYNVELFSVYSDKKAAVVERLIRTIKEKLFKIFTRNGNYKWLDVLPLVIKAYNNSYHRGLKNIPSQVNKTNEIDVWIKQYSDLIKGTKPKFKVGDRVRTSIHKSIFSKGYTQKWTDEEFIISNVNTKYNPILYSLVDLNGNNIKGSFYENELQLSLQDGLYRIDRIIRTKTIGKKKMALVKWIGYDEPSWINYKDISHINK